MATLKWHIESFYGGVCGALGIRLDEAASRFDRAYVIQLLNDCWARAAEDTGGLTCLTKHTLTSGQETYSLSASTLSLTPIINIRVVQLLKNSKLATTLYPSDANALQTPDAMLDSGMPSTCCYSIQKHDSATAIYELRLSPPSDWTETGGLWITCAVRPATITADTDSPDVLDTMARMGVAWACYEATGLERFRVSYENDKRLFGKTGIDNMPRVKRSAFGTVVTDDLPFSRVAQ
jgi:hypothetical protein